MKTIREWIETLPEDVRQKALKYEKDQRWHWRRNDNADWNKVEESTWHALLNAFSWYNSDEGYDYWHDIAYGETIGAYKTEEEVGSAINACDVQVSGIDISLKAAYKVYKLPYSASLAILKDNITSAKMKAKELLSMLEELDKKVTFYKKPKQE